MTELERKYLPTKLAGYLGFTVQAIVNNFLPILFVVFQDIYGLGYEKLGRLIVFNFATQMVIDFLTPKIIDKIGYRRAAFLSQLTACLGLCLMAFLPRIMDSYLAIILSITVYATGSGLMEVILSPMIEMLPTGNKSGNMAVLHSFYCWGQAFIVPLTTLMVFAFGQGENWSFIPLIWAVAPFINMLAFLKVPIVEPKKEEKQATLTELLKTPKFVVYMLMMFCAGASEIAMAQWASLFVEEALDVPKAVGDVAGPCLFALFMAIGRVVYARFSKKVSFTKLLLWLNVLCFVCYVTVALCDVAVLSLVFCALCGLSVSISWPGLYSAGARNFKTGGAVMFSAFAMCGDTGCALGPGLVGLVAEYTNNLSYGFLAVSIFPLIMVICTLYILKNRVAKK